MIHLRTQTNSRELARSMPPPVVREMPADLETPMSVYLKLAGRGPSFLLESVTGGERLARYSFIGINPRRAYLLRGQSLEVHADGEIQTIPISPGSDPLDYLRETLDGFRMEAVHGLPRFTGGLVGYLGYEIVRFFEPTVPVKPAGELPDGIFLLTDTTVVFDHAYGKLLLVANVVPEGDEETARAEAEARLDEIQRRLNGSLPKPERPVRSPAGGAFVSNVSREQFIRSVQAAKEYISAGDIFQVVLSQRLSRKTSAAPLDIYRALRRLNPSPYMFFFDFAGLVDGEDLRVIGASPELHVRLEGDRATLRPIAGTITRGKTPVEDLENEQHLLADPKERAEHVMLVDLGRNDLGRVCAYRTVHVPEQMQVERYSHVMHIVSQVEGQLRPELDAFDLMRATFPAGTVSGAPKIRAMQIIDELEPDARGLYSGVVGYFAADGSMDTCITIRTLVMRGQTISVQAGAGIVADSDPEREYQETLNKARALAVAVEQAEGSGENGQGS